PAGGWATGECAGAAAIWLLIEEQADGTIKYAFSNLPATASRIKAVRLWRGRRPGEQGEHEMKGGGGVGPTEGPCRGGLPPPRLPGDAGLRVPGAGATATEAGADEDPGPPGKKGGPQPVVTLPSVRRALQKLLAPVCRHDCDSCRGKAVMPPQHLTE